MLKSESVSPPVLFFFKDCFGCSGFLEDSGGFVLVCLFLTLPWLAECFIKRREKSVPEKKKELSDWTVSPTNLYLSYNSFVAEVAKLLTIH